MKLQITTLCGLLLMDGALVQQLDDAIPLAIMGMLIIITGAVAIGLAAVTPHEDAE